MISWYTAKQRIDWPVAKRVNSKRFCEGWSFRYFRNTGSRRKQPCKANTTFLAAEEQILKKIQFMLCFRPDLMEEIGCIENGLEIRLYEGMGFMDYESETYFYGQVTYEREHMIMELSADQVLEGCREDHTATDVVIHEIAHVLDFIEGNHEACFPGWRASTRAQFKQLMLKEQARIEACLTDGRPSPIDPYALTNPTEFLAVLTETFFCQPGMLREYNPELYGIFRNYFGFEPGPLPVVCPPSQK